MKQHLACAVAALWVAALGYALWVSPVQSVGFLAGTGVRLSIVASIALIITHARFFGTRRGLVLLVVVHLLAQLWLQLQWAWWNLTMLQRVNVFIAVIAADTLVATLAGLTVLLTRRDASVFVLCTSVVGWSLFLFVAVQHYDNISRLLQLSTRDLLPVDALVASLCYLSLMGMITFIIHSARLLFNELTSSPMDKASMIEARGIFNERG